MITHQLVLSERIRAILPEAKLEVVKLPDVPEISLCLLEDSCFRRPLTEQEVSAAWTHPPYWAFCWASGQAMARYLLDHPGDVSTKRVVDFGCGSGIAAIAAVKAGAKVIACDIDPDALQATKLNAELNSLLIIDGDERLQANPNSQLWDLVSEQEWRNTIVLCSDMNRIGKAECLLAADVLYDPQNLPLLDSFCEWSKSVLVADSRVRNFSHQDYQWEFEIQSITLPDLDELLMHRCVNFYRRVS
ncbi:class I SAM-dependent methyltransferase [Umboniibacter marinipuniceus]|uniref:Putative nicotinamide N-methyase n=1 Tax=Umboniibacter marinipuniceus TaxID=569599 RepID=A0A3M0A4F6_9GAMM|nr:50S ribosomal protein L11 methyltransferase [Umboniibacter marinipuniceus]RMA79497.1 putative nicotinamide N-methyase [Umboniibacter marinipuniceus]